MGLLDGLIGNVVGSMLSGNQAQSPLGSVLGGLGVGVIAKLIMPGKENMGFIVTTLTRYCRFVCCHLFGPGGGLV
jgi:hypothetical protein